MPVTVNGKAYDHGQTRIEVTLPDGTSSGLTKKFSDFSYDETIERGNQIGAEAIPDQDTEGQYKATASVTFYRALFDAIFAWFVENNLPFATTEMSLAFQYWSKGEAVTVDTIPRCKWQKSAFSSSEGTDPTKVPVELKVLDTIYHNGVDVYGRAL